MQTSTLPKLFLLFYLYLTYHSNAQTLIVAEYRIDQPKIGNYTYLTAFHFVNGIFHSKDTIAGFPTNRAGHPGSYVRFDLGENFIYKNQYVISGTGNVIDLKTGKLVIEESDVFVEAKGDSIIFQRENIFTGTGQLLLNLSNGKYRFINKNPVNRQRQYSPDHRHSLYVDQSKLPYKIFLSDSSNLEKRLLVSDAGTGPNLTTDSQFPNILTHWISNNEFLYTVHRLYKPVNDPNCSRVMMHKYNIDTGADSLFTQLDYEITGFLNDKFLTDGISQTIYRTSGMNHYLLDKKQGLLPYPSWQYGYDFSIDNEFKKEYGNIIRYKGAEIGRLWVNPGVVTNGAIALEYGEVGSNLGYPKGFKVWTTLSQSWITICLPWICSVIGWIK